MSLQNPVFIPGPTNMPEVLRKAVDMPTIDHRSPLFGAILHPALAGVKKVLRSERAQVFVDTVHQLNRCTPLKDGEAA